MLFDSIPDDWRRALPSVLDTPAAKQLCQFLDDEAAAGKRIYPPARERFRALELTPLNAVKVLILGQDPYHGEGQAHGLAFSVAKGVKIPSSLRNIYKELQSDLGLPGPAHGFLEDWARQGVLMLNDVLSVEAGQAHSHKGRGWEAITDAVVAAVAARAEPCVFLLWGGPAQKKAGRIADMQAPRHLTLTAPHPSGLSAYKGFWGCRHFSQTNAFLQGAGRGAVDWRVGD